MHRLILIVIAILLGFSSRAAASAADDGRVHLFILSGQSNMEGLDPDASFTPAVNKAFGRDRVIVVKDAKGGQPIRRWYRDWKPSSGDPPRGDNGELYDQLLTKVAAAIEGRTIATVTFVWMQGERDARESHGDVYAASFRGLLKQLEDDLGRDDINVVIGRLSDFDLANEKYPHWTLVRRAQMNLAASMPNATWVDTDDLNDGRNRAGQPIRNDLHYSVDGYSELGRRFAHDAITLIRRARKPNIILVMADDQGWGDTGYNGHPFVETPALDVMSANGFTFDRFYTAAPVCSPTRASILTGRAPVRTRVTNHGRYLRPHEQTLAETLGDAGYVTGIFGKYHLGTGQPDSPCNPSGAGFDEWVIGVNFFDNDPYLSRNGVVEHRKGKGSVILMDDALDFLRAHHRDDQPIFAVIWFPSPHVPHDEVPNGRDRYGDQEHAAYYREITLLDQQLGRLRRELRAMNIADNTILWYCSDNGGLVGRTSGGRAKKGSIYEGGLRVPSIIEWPARNFTGRSDRPVWTCDMFPTLLSLAEIDNVPPHHLDGVDISAVFGAERSARHQPMGFWHRFQGGQVTRSDQILKAIMEKQHAGDPTPHDPPRMRKDVDEFPQFPEDYANGHAAWNDWPYKLHRINGDTFELYNLALDPMETNDLASSLRHLRRLERMKKELDAWMRSVVRSINGDDYDLPHAASEPGDAAESQESTRR